jgi:hypothetical protein
MGSMDVSNVVSDFFCIVVLQFWGVRHWWEYSDGTFECTVCLVVFIPTFLLNRLLPKLMYNLATPVCQDVQVKRVNASIWLPVHWAQKLNMEMIYFLSMITYLIWLFLRILSSLRFRCAT